MFYYLTVQQKTKFLYSKNLLGLDNSIVVLHFNKNVGENSSNIQLNGIRKIFI